jgi:hypothetical protein
MEEEKDNFLKTINVQDYPPTKKLSELVINQTYEVTEISRINTKYGSRIIVTLNDEFQVFLPPKYAKKFTQEHIEMFRNKKYALIYEGMKQGTSTSYSYHSINFI